MSGDYLWDASGPPDPEVERLETVLRPLRRLPAPPTFPARPAARPGWRALAAAAAVIVALASVPLRSPRVTGWELTWAASGRHGSGIGEVETSLLRAGEWLETGERRMRLSVGRIGVVHLGPATRVGLVDAGEREHRLSLARGTLQATIWAPPGQFLVDTPAAVAVDLGCAYTLEVAADGSGLLHVETGWVGFEHGAVRSLIPAGAWCRTRPGLGPGTPRFDSAPQELAAALDRIDAAGVPVAARRSALATVLAQARPRDALSLWHLLSRVDTAERERVFDRLAALVPPPAGVTRDGVAHGDAAMRDLWWDELGLGSSEFWRQWTRRTR